MTDRAATVSRIAERDKVTMSYVSRIVPLGFLSPEIVESILSGNQSPEVTAWQAAMHLDVPLTWSFQRKMLTKNSER